jgi:polyphenol oxidase
MRRRFGKEAAMKPLDRTSIGTRRRFLEDLGLGASALGLLGLGELSLPASAIAQVCSPPGSPGTPVPWRRDCRPIRPRRPASSLSSGEAQKLKDAYKAMRDLDTSDPNDPRGFTHQANVHCWNCGQSTQIHGRWSFFVWHRAEVYFHERILGKLIGDEDFRLPYWDWENVTHRSLPGPFTSPNDASNPLFNPTRTKSPTDVLPEAWVGDDVMEAALTLGNFTEFGGTATGPGSPEGTPHGPVHGWVGGNMGNFFNAARDPVFYAHHANIDKLWSDWNRLDSLHTNPTDPAFLGLTFTFFDENKVWRSIKASQVLDHENRLRYVYGPSRLWERLLCLILDWFVVKTTWPTLQVLQIDRRVREPLQKALTAKAPVRLHLEALSLPVDRTEIYQIYADAGEAEANRGADSPSFLGAVSVVLNDPENRHPVRTVPNAILQVTKRIPALLQRNGRIELFAVASEAKRGSRPFKLKARNVYFSWGRETKA